MQSEQLQIERIAMPSEMLCAQAQLRAEVGASGANAFQSRVFLNDCVRDVFQLVVRVDQQNRKVLVERDGMQRVQYSLVFEISPRKSRVRSVLFDGSCAN